MNTEQFQQQKHWCASQCIATTENSFLSELVKIRYDMIQYIYMSSKADEMASLI